jgi:hypothetical protein
MKEGKIGMVCCEREYDDESVSCAELEGHMYRNAAPGPVIVNLWDVFTFS